MATGSSTSASGFHTHQAHLRVYKGKDRQDEEVHRRGNVVLKALQRRRDAVHHALDPARGVRKVMLTQDVRLVVEALLEQPAA